MATHSPMNSLGRSQSSPHFPEPQIRPGWPEMAVGLIIFLLLLVLIGFCLLQIPDEQAEFRGIAGMAANGVAGIAALMAANILRVCDLRAFGFRTAGAKWLLAGATLGVAAFGLSFIIEWVYFLFVTEANTQADFQAAARAGPWSLFLLLITGAVLTPLGEEVLFRGVIANVLNRYGAWSGVVASAAIFAVIHGPSVILLDAFMVGILTGILFRKTRSLWPCFLLHLVYNGLHLLYYSTL
jgi:uncharacterized protein